MFRNRFFRRILHQNLFEIDQVKIVYFLSLVVELPDNRFVLVGMAGMMAGVMHAPLTANYLLNYQKNKCLKIIYYEKRYFDF
jgi:hypothetical protein